MAVVATYRIGYFKTRFGYERGRIDNVVAGLCCFRSLSSHRDKLFKYLLLQVLQ